MRSFTPPKTAKAPATSVAPRMQPLARVQLAQRLRQRAIADPNLTGALRQEIRRRAANLMALNLYEAGKAPKGQPPQSQLT